MGIIDTLWTLGGLFFVLGLVGVAGCLFAGCFNLVFTKPRPMATPRKITKPLKR